MPSNFDWPSFLLLAAGFALLYLPTYAELATTVWATDEQGHGPIILAVSAWLLYVRRHAIAAAPYKPMAGLGWALLLFAAMLYAFGTSQQIYMFQVGSQIAVLAALLLLFRGVTGLKIAWFPLFFLFFMIPLPEALVAAVTSPLKSAVSAVATSLLYMLGYPCILTKVVEMPNTFTHTPNRRCAKHHLSIHIQWNMKDELPPKRP